MSNEWTIRFEDDWDKQQTGENLGVDVFCDYQGRVEWPEGRTEESD